jgi:hypothetical protein
VNNYTASYIITRHGWSSSGADALVGLIVSITIALGSSYGFHLWIIDLSPTGFYSVVFHGNKRTVKAEDKE